MSAAATSGRDRRTITLVAAAVSIALAWAIDTVWSPFPHLVLKIVVGASLLSAAAALAQAVVAAWRGGGDPAEAKAGRALLALLGASLVVRFAGLDFEVISHYHNDEGVFLAEAKRINAGRLLPDSFNYPHLLYYTSALTLWLRDLFPGLAGGYAKLLYGVTSSLEIDRMALRGLAALFGALTTIPVFLAAKRVHSLTAAIAAGLLIAFSSVYNEVAHLVISDVPSGFFAALTLLFVARLLDGESYRDYLGAGVSSGLAAASKYPAGVVAVAIVGVWLYWRARRRNLSAHLAAAGAASLGAFVAATPALLFSRGAAFAGSGKDVLFGFRQYARLGWIGVVKDSNSAWYGEQLALNFGLLAIVVGAIGWLALRRREGVRLAIMLIYPIVFLALLVSMNMVVKRNLQPVIPGLAVVLGVGIAAWPHRFAERLPGTRAAWSAALVALCVAAPVVRTGLWDISRMRPGTSRLALQWIDENTPQGSAFLREAYTPRIHSKRYVSANSRYAARLPLERIRDGSLDYLLLAKNAFRRFLDPDRHVKSHHAEYAARYEVMQSFELVQEFRPDAIRAGPHLFLYRIDPESIVYRTQRHFRPIEAMYYSHVELRPNGDIEGPIVFQRKGQSVVFKDYFEPGRYRVSFSGEAGNVDGWLYVVRRDNLVVGEYTVTGGVDVELPERGKYFFRVFLPGGPLTGVTVAPPDGSPASEPAGEAPAAPADGAQSPGAAAD